MSAATAVKVHVSTKIARSARVTQVESMFDVPPSAKSGRSWDVEMPIDEFDWNVGLIVGPSGSGKTTIAKHLFGERVVREFAWDPAKAVLDGFPKDMSVKEIVGTLTAVGFSTPPSWLQPYQTLSTGEQFRATLARAICETPVDDFAVVDEFTSTVDRQVAKVASHAVQKAVRRSGKKLIALSCHNDIIDWLQPDWIYQTHLGRFTRRRLRRTRPPIELDIHPVDRSVWPLFRDHHYLSGDLAKGAQCVGCFVDGQIVAFGSYLHFPGTRRPAKKGHRFVVLPDWQGLGIMTALDDWLGEYLWARGFEWRATFGHQAMIAQRLRNPRWRLLSAPKKNRQLHAQDHVGTQRGGMPARNLNPRMLRTYTFVYMPKEGDAARARCGDDHVVNSESIDTTPELKEARRVAVKGARSRIRYSRSKASRQLATEKAVARRTARKRLLEIEPTKTCVGITELPDHVCSKHPMECHHRDGNWRNDADDNLAWACRRAHEELDRRLGV